VEIKRIAIYTRVSTADQHPEMQEAELMAYAHRRGWTSKVYRDQGQSGAKENRPGLDALLADVRKRKLDVVAVWSLDRLARSVSHLVRLAEEFNALRVDFISLKQSIDTTTPAGRLTYHVLAAVAEFERELVRERVRAGLVQARKRGKELGRPPLRRFSNDEKRVLRALRRQGASIRGLATRFSTTQYVVNKLVQEQSA
jgi:DNA invertase Pin-like site-specific DNA recombinase